MYKVGGEGNYLGNQENGDSYLTVCVIILVRGDVSI